MKMLDAGAYGIICPMGNNRADAEKLVSAMHYPPRGSRSFGPIRALLYAGGDYAREAMPVWDSPASPIGPTGR
jgi:4-hydroxy-2-oxoheptanedioate aldolase